MTATTTRFPTNALADDALLWAGLSASRRKEYERAVELLGRLAEQYPTSPKLPEARFAQGEAQTEMSKFDTAILIFDEIIRLHPESELAARAWGRKGDCQFSMGSGIAKRFEDSLVSYRVVANSSAAEPDLVLQAEFKIGRCLEKLGRPQDAFDQYYTHVIVPFFLERDKGVWHGEAGKTWFSRAARQAVELLEVGNEWRQAVRIYERIVEAGVPEAAWAKERIEKIKSEQWWLFR
jgi:tetratricopeptide (TPR) repeat protein